MIHEVTKADDDVFISHNIFIFRYMFVSLIMRHAFCCSMQVFTIVSKDFCLHDSLDTIRDTDIKNSHSLSLVSCPVFVKFSWQFRNFFAEILIFYCHCIVQAWRKRPMGLSPNLRRLDFSSSSSNFCKVRV